MNKPFATPWGSHVRFEAISMTHRIFGAANFKYTRLLFTVIVRICFEVSDNLSPTVTRSKGHVNQNSWVFFVISHSSDTIVFWKWHCRCSIEWVRTTDFKLCKPLFRYQHWSSQMLSLPKIWHRKTHYQSRKFEVLGNLHLVMLRHNTCMCPHRKFQKGWTDLRTKPSL